MYLYQLAWELDQEPPALAQRAEALGLGTLDPSDELTAEQETTLRASLGHSGTAVPVPAAASLTFTTPVKPPEPAEPPAPRRATGERTKKVAVVAVGALAFVGAVAFFASQASPAEERRSERNQELAAWQDAPPATVAPEVAAAADFPADQPRDRAKLCAAYQTAHELETSSTEVEENELDWTEFRAWAADRSEWQAAIDEMVDTGPTDAVPDIRDYQKVRARYYAIMTQVSDAQLRALSQGVELGDLEGYERAVDRAQRDMDAYLTPICGQPKG
ncbi:MAG: hypothetical protein JWO77_1990 [Ilumatobacteraceae bacterium]|nr:hypothetical protein [Ilumatobacteraceae bacterium]